jgi:hypothetical protein
MGEGFTQAKRRKAKKRWPTKITSGGVDLAGETIMNKNCFQELNRSFQATLRRMRCEHFPDNPGKT